MKERGLELRSAASMKTIRTRDASARLLHPTNALPSPHSLPIETLVAAIEALPDALAAKLRGERAYAE